MIHELKTRPLYFNAILTGRQKFEVRKNDKGFKENDVLILREWETCRNDYTGRSIAVNVSYVLEGEDLGIKKGFVVMSLK